MEVYLVQILPHEDQPHVVAIDQMVTDDCAVFSVAIELLVARKNLRINPSYIWI